MALQRCSTQQRGHDTVVIVPANSPPTPNDCMDILAAINTLSVYSVASNNRIYVETPTNNKPVTKPSNVFVINTTVNLTRLYKNPHVKHVYVMSNVQEQQVLQQSLPAHEKLTILNQPLGKSNATTLYCFLFPCEAIPLAYRMIALTMQQVPDNPESILTQAWERYIQHAVPNLTPVLHIPEQHLYVQLQTSTDHFQLTQLTRFYVNVVPNIRTATINNMRVFMINWTNQPSTVDDLISCILDHNYSQLPRNAFNLGVFGILIQSGAIIITVIFNNPMYSLESFTTKLGGNVVDSRGTISGCLPDNKNYLINADMLPEFPPQFIKYDVVVVS